MSKRADILLLRARQIIRLWPALTCLLFSLSPPSVFSQNYSEQEIQAALLYNATKFISWPQSTFATPQDPLRLCIAGTDRVNPAFNLLEDKTVRGHPISLIYTTRIDAPNSTCHALYIGESEKAGLQNILDSIAAQPVLTIGNFEEFVEMGGILSLKKTGKRIKLVINGETSKSSGLIINSQLLEMAEVVYGSEEKLAKKDGV